MDKRFVGPIPGRSLCFDLEEYGCGEHCCAEMNLHIHEKEKIIQYFPSVREYAIRIEESLIQGLKFCSWCGKELPESLSDALFDLLEQEYGEIADIGNYKNDPNIPDEFRSEEWWRKRGL